MACLLALAVWASPLRADDPVREPFLPETMHNYEGVVPAGPLARQGVSESTAAGAAIADDNTPADNPVSNAGVC